MDNDGRIDVLFTQQNACPDCPGGGNSPGGIHVLLNTSLPGRSRDINGDRIPDECQGKPFHRGDSSADGVLNLTDAVTTLQYLFQAGPAPSCLESADSDNNGRIDLSDPIQILSFLFRGGPSPAPPGPPPAPCGLDTDPVGAPGDMGCGAYSPCQ